MDEKHCLGHSPLWSAGRRIIMGKLGWNLANDHDPHLIWRFISTYLVIELRPCRIVTETKVYPSFGWLGKESPLAWCSWILEVAPHDQLAPAGLSWVRKTLLPNRRHLLLCHHSLGRAYHT